MKKGNQYSLKAAQQQAFLQVFNLHAKDGKINRDDLLDIFDRVGYNVSTHNFNDICEKAFGEKERIGFEQLIQIFRVKESNYDLIDIKNAFRLIAGDEDTYISVSQMEQIFRKQGIEKDRIKQIMELLGTYIEDGKFNYKLFVSHLF